MDIRLDDVSDDDLQRLLGDALNRTEAVPDDAVQAAYAAVELDAVAEELASLVFDSAADRELTLMRATEQETRLLSFVNDHLTLDLELHGDGQTIVGQLSPPTSASVLVDLDDGDTITVATDDFGRFRAKAPVGALRLRVTGLLVTPWITRS